MCFELDPEAAVPYLRRTGRLPPGAAGTASSRGGRSNRVVRVDHDDGCVVMKQPRRRLADESGTAAERDRVHREAGALRALGRVAERCDADVAVPEVRFEDRETNVVGLGCAPAGTTWRSELLDGRVDPAVAATLGAFLAAVHRATATDELPTGAGAGDAPAVDADWLRAQVPETDVFDRFRVQRYHRPVAAAHPDLAATVAAEVDRLRAAAATLLHGDYNPKNVLVARDGGLRCWVFDPEFACWGDPAWDVASALAHVYVPAVHVREDHEPYLAAADRFWRAYRRRVPWSLEEAAVAETAILLLARVDGEATLSYLSDRTADALRTIGRDGLRAGVASVDALAGRVRDACQ